MTLNGFLCSRNLKDNLIGLVNGRFCQSRCVIFIFSYFWFLGGRNLQFKVKLLKTHISKTLNRGNTAIIANLHSIGSKTIFGTCFKSSRFSIRAIVHCTMYKTVFSIHSKLYMWDLSVNCVTAIDFVTKNRFLLSNPTNSVIER